MAALPVFEERSRQRAAIVLISDGADTASDAHVRDVRSALLRSDAFVYAIAIDPPADTRPINARVNPYALRAITDDSGGRTEVVHDSADSRGGHGADRRGTEPPVRARVHVPPPARRPVPQPARARHPSRPPRPRPAGLRGGPVGGGRFAAHRPPVTDALK